jgi:hypothetical protein
MANFFKLDALGRKGLSLEGYKMVAQTMFLQGGGEQLFKEEGIKLLSRKTSLGEKD